MSGAGLVGGMHLRRWAGAGAGPVGTLLEQVVLPRGHGTLPGREGGRCR